MNINLFLILFIHCLYFFPLSAPLFPTLGLASRSNTRGTRKRKKSSGSAAIYWIHHQHFFYSMAARFHRFGRVAVASVSARPSLLTPFAGGSRCAFRASSACSDSSRILLSPSGLSRCSAIKFNWRQFSSAAEEVEETATSTTRGTAADPETREIWFRGEKEMITYDLAAQLHGNHPDSKKFKNRHKIANHTMHMLRKEFADELSSRRNEQGFPRPETGDAVEVEYKSSNDGDVRRVRGVVTSRRWNGAESRFSMLTHANNQQLEFTFKYFSPHLISLKILKHRWLTDGKRPKRVVRRDLMALDPSFYSLNDKLTRKKRKRTRKTRKAKVRKAKTS